MGERREAPAPARASRRLLIGIFVAALLPRLWSVGWALPLKTAHIDEAVVVFYSLRAASGDPNPRGFYDYPGFFLYGLAAVFKGSLAFVRLCGWAVPPDAQAWDAYMKDDGLIFLLVVARLLVVLMGAATAVVICRMGTARAGAFVGSAAALLWAANPLAVAQAHYATVDTPAVFLVLLAVERMVHYVEEGGKRDGLWAAFLVGLGAATKYYPGALALFLLPLPFWRKSRRPWNAAFLMAAVMAGTFLACNPYMLLEARSFLGRFAHEFAAVVWGAGDGRGTILWPTLKGLWVNAGPLPLLLFAVETVFLFRSARRGDSLLAGVTVFLLLFFGLWSVQEPRYALGVYPMIFLAAGGALKRAGRWGRALPSVGLALSVGAALPATASYLKLISRPDTRLQALAWARETLPPGARLLRFARTPEFSRRDPFAVSVDWENKRLAGGAGALDVSDVDFLIHGSYQPGDAESEDLGRRFELVKRFDAPAPVFPHDPVVSVYRARKP